MDNIDLVDYHVGILSMPPEYVEDCKQVATLALIKAVENWNPERCPSLKIFSFKGIRTSIVRYLKKNKYHKPINIETTIRKIKNKAGTGNAFLLTDKELSLKTGIRINEIQLARYWDSLEVRSLGKGEDRRDTNTNEYTYDYGNARVVKRLMRNLLDVERKVINHRYGFNGNEFLTYDELGEKYGIHLSYMEFVEKRALKKMRNILKSKKVEIEVI